MPTPASAPTPAPAPAPSAGRSGGAAATTAHTLGPLHDEHARLTAQLRELARENHELQEAVFSAAAMPDDGRGGSGGGRAAQSEQPSNCVLPALEARLDLLLSRELAHMAAMSGSNGAFTTAAATLPAPLQSSAHGGSDAIEAVRVACRFHSTGGASPVAGTMPSDFEEEEFFFLRLSPEVATFDDLKREALRFWRVPSRLHLRCKLVGHDGALWPLGTLVHEAFSNLKVSPEVWLVVTEPYSFDDVQALGAGALALQAPGHLAEASLPSNESAADKDAQRVLQQLVDSDAEPRGNEDEAARVSLSEQALRQQAVRLHAMVWLFLVVGLACVAHVFFFGGAARAYVVDQLVAKFLQLDEIFGTSTSSVLAASSSDFDNQDISLPALREMTLDDVVQYLESTLSASVFDNRDLGLGVVVGNLLLQTTRVVQSTCGAIGARAAAADSQIQASVCFPVEYNAETLSTAAYGSTSQFVYVSGDFDTEWSSSSAGFFQPLPVRTTEAAQWAQIFADLRTAGFWDIQTHATTLFGTLYSRNLHVVVAVTVAFTRLASGNFAPTSAFQFYPVQGFLGANSTETADLWFKHSALTGIPALVVAAAVALTLLWMHLRAELPFTRGWRRICVLVMNPGVLACLLSLVCSVASAVLLGAFLLNTDAAANATLSFQVPSVTLDVGFVSNASSLAYPGAYKSQWWPATLYSMHSYCFAIAVATVCLPFAELALLWPSTREPFRLISLSSRKLVVPIAVDVLLFCSFAASGRLLTGSVILNSGTILDWLRLLVDCLWHGQALFSVFTSPTSPALVAQMAFITACIIYICAITVPMYYAIVHDALLRLRADARAHERMRVLNFSWRRLLDPPRPFVSKEGAAAAPPATISLHSRADDAVWRDRSGWLPRRGAEEGDSDDMFALTE